MGGGQFDHNRKDRPLTRRTLTEKAGENRRTDTRHAFANQRLNRFHVNLPGPTAVGEDLSCEAACFAEGFLLDRFESFFPDRAVRLVRLAAIGRSGR